MLTFHNITFPFIVLLTTGFIYFLPAVVATAREHHQRPAIAVLNLLLGWTLIGWALALVWACTATTKKGTAP